MSVSAVASSSSWLYIAKAFLSRRRARTLRASRDGLPPASMSSDWSSASPIRWILERSTSDSSAAFVIILCAMRVVSWK